MKNDPTSKLLKSFIEYFGTRYELALQLKRTPPTVYKWEKIPPQACYEIQELVNFKFKARDLMELTWDSADWKKLGGKLKKNDLGKKIKLR